MGVSAYVLLGWCRAAEGGVGGTLPLPTGRSPVRGCAPQAWALRPVRSSAGAKQQGGGRAAVPRRSKPGLGRSPTCVGASPRMLLGWCRAVKQGALGRFPLVLGEAQAGQEPRVCGRFGLHAARLVQSSGGGGRSTQLIPAGRSPVRAGAPRERALRPIRYSAGTEQRRAGGGRVAAPRRARPGPGWSPACVGASPHEQLC